MSINIPHRWTLERKARRFRRRATSAKKCIDCKWFVGRVSVSREARGFLRDPEILHPLRRFTQER